MTPAVGGIAALTGLSAVGLTAVSKRLERKITKHEKIYTLAVAKQNSVSELVSKALADKTITDAEFTIIIKEVERYHKLKAEIRAGASGTQPQSGQTQVQAPDLEKIRKEIRDEERKKLQKKISSLAAQSKSDLRN